MTHKLPVEVLEYYNNKLFAAIEDQRIYEKEIGKKLTTSKDWGEYAAYGAMRNAGCRQKKE